MCCGLLLSGRGVGRLHLGGVAFRGCCVTKFPPHKILNSIVRRQVDFSWKDRSPTCGGPGGWSPASWGVVKRSASQVFRGAPRKTPPLCSFLFVATSFSKIVWAIRPLRNCLGHETEGVQKGRCKTLWKREFKLLWREAGPPNHHDDRVDLDQ